MLSRESKNQHRPYYIKYILFFRNRYIYYMTANKRQTQKLT